jgi:hypothetical protein
MLIRFSYIEKYSDWRKIRRWTIQSFDFTIHDSFVSNQ